GGQGHGRDDIRTSVELDIRSTGQLYVVTITSPVTRIEGREDLAAVLKTYFEEYGDRFGDLALTKEIGVSIEAVRLRAWMPRPAHRMAEYPPATGGVEVALKSSRECWWASETEARPTNVYDYAALAPGHRVEGPAIIEASDTTIVVEPGWRGEMDGNGFFR